MIGQDAVATAQAFDDALDITGVMLTKLDGDARGGAALSIRAATGKPIKFMGTGEKLDMIEPFHPDRMAQRILGMGDVLSFIERAEQSIDEEKAKKLEEKLKKNRFTLSDYYDQLVQLKSMGSFEQLAGMMPGQLGKQMANAELDPKDDGTHRGDHPLDDTLRARESRGARRQPQKAQSPPAADSRLWTSTACSSSLR